MITSACFSPCRKYRYSLIREWGGLFSNNLSIMFIGLNPSTADATLDDPTIRREINFAKAWGYSGLYKVNLFGYRSTDPKKLKDVEDPIGPENDDYIINIGKSNKVGRIVAAWGTLGTFKNRDKTVKAFFDEIYHLGLTKDGHPKHPLYLSKNTQLERWSI